MDATSKSKLEKIARLMEAAGTPGEAEAAAAAFQRLVMKMNLTAEDLKGLGKDDGAEYVSQTVIVAPEGKTGVTWRVYLLNAVARYNFCQAIRVGAHGGRMYLVGQRRNVEAVMSMYVTMGPVFERLAVASWHAEAAEARRLGWRAPHKVRWTNSFLQGVPAGLIAKFKAERAEEEAADASVSALVVVKDAELRRAVTDLVGGTTTPKHKINSLSSAYESGYQAGRDYEHARAQMTEGAKALRG